MLGEKAGTPAFESEKDDSVDLADDAAEIELSQDGSQYSENSFAAGDLEESRPN